MALSLGGPMAWKDKLVTPGSNSKNARLTARSRMTMDFNDTPEEAAFRKEVRAWLDANATRKSDDKQSFRARNDDPELLKKAKEWQRRRPPPATRASPGRRSIGGRGGSPILQVIYQQEEANYLVPLGFFDIGLGMCIPTMMAYAAPEQLKRYVRPALHGEEVWCQLFSEPAAGSDVAGIRTRRRETRRRRTG